MPFSLFAKTGKMHDAKALRNDCEWNSLFDISSSYVAAWKHNLKYYAKQQSSIYSDHLFLCLISMGHCKEDVTLVR